MKKAPTEEDLRKIASQLRKPEGENGIEIGEIMNDANGPMNRHTIAVLNPEANDAILEIGMANGLFVKNIVRLDDSIKYTGCDYSKLMVELAANSNRDFVKQGKARFIHANANKLPFENHSFDKIFTINTFYFWDDHVKVLQELIRVLKKDGTLVLSITSKHLLEKSPMAKYGFASFSKEEIIEMMRSNGFASIEVTEIKEPDQVLWENKFEKESQIYSCKFHAEKGD
jgi:SAM-dependent methyltransferase